MGREKKKTQKTTIDWKSPIVIAALIALLGVMITGIANIATTRFQTERPISATQTAETRQTLLAASSNLAPSGSPAGTLAPEVMATTTQQETAVRPNNTSLQPTENPPIEGPVISRTPSPITFLVTLKEGNDIQLTSLEVGIPVQGTYGYALYAYPGIPTDDHLHISFDYISRVEFPSGNPGVDQVIRLIDGSVQESVFPEWLKGNLRASGNSPLGTFDEALERIESIAVQRQDASAVIPQAVPSGLLATVIAKDGEAAQISNPLFVYFYRPLSSNLSGCHTTFYQNLPTSQGVNIDFTKLTEIEFFYDEGQDNPVPVEVATGEGDVQQYDLVAAYPNGDLIPPCSIAWLVKGQVATGQYEIPLRSVSKIVFEGHAP